jgi:hypothetical protein
LTSRNKLDLLGFRKPKKDIATHSPISLALARGIFNEQSKYNILRCSEDPSDDDKREATLIERCSEASIHIPLPLKEHYRSINMSQRVVILRDGENTEFSSIPEFQAAPNLIYLGRDFTDKKLPSTQVKLASVSLTCVV